jgi:hypothetical protein
LDPPVLHTDCLILGSANHIFEYVDDSFFEKLIHLNREVFEMIHSLFFPFWHLSINGGSHSRLHSHHLCIFLYLQQIGDIARNLYGEVMQICIIITDGSLHTLEKNECVQSNYFYDEHHPDYNG